MTGRTVVIGDIPWVAQAADAFLSKLFACSYSIAGVNVQNGNAQDHLVHRHTHRVVRGTLLLCGRPDGRLSALSSAESSVCLSLNQASSIQSIGGSCESVTIGHNPWSMSLTKKDVFLQSFRPHFLCERLVEQKAMAEGHNLRDINTSPHNMLGTYMSWAYDAKTRRKSKDKGRGWTRLDSVMEKMIQQQIERKAVNDIFQKSDVDKQGELNVEQFVRAYSEVNPQMTSEDAIKLFDEYDPKRRGSIQFDDFLMISKLPESQVW
uniref:EF-hand domain-containing protein n=1 Tax=Cyclophora tenuis TaxID=216820 RepID=A0A7S1GRL4_CYCTE|mmetsp:Transcript_757/g.1343  ORF Transcript_757/g.1343 Transcript_757/m.1343 type:complete len:264 (+) Transcript_757:278-1069(+)